MLDHLAEQINDEKEDKNNGNNGVFQQMLKLFH